MKILVDNNIVDVTTIAAMTDIELSYDYEYDTEIKSHSFVFSFDIIFIGKNTITIQKTINISSYEIYELKRNIRFIEDYHIINRNKNNKNNMSLDEFNEKLNLYEFDSDINRVNEKLDTIDSLFKLKDNNIKNTQCPQYNNFNNLRLEILKLWNETKIDLPTFNVEDY